ncbi:MAG: DUF1697 domain-containing protein [Bacillus sp. (in: firmicutes)]
MTVYIALIRGINVGGHNRIKMKELKDLLSTNGLEQVTTYIQSGNIVFRSDEKAETVQQLIEQEIQNFYGFSVTVMVRAALEWEQIIHHCPYPANALAEGESVHLALLKAAFTEEKMNALLAYQSGTEVCHIHEKVVYVYLRQSFHKSKLAIQLQKIGNPTTVRNWKTVMKLEMMAQAMQE